MCKPVCRISECEKLASFENHGKISADSIAHNTTKKHGKWSVGGGWTKVAKRCLDRDLSAHKQKTQRSEAMTIASGQAHSATSTNSNNDSSAIRLAAANQSPSSLSSPAAAAVPQPQSANAMGSNDTVVDKQQPARVALITGITGQDGSYLSELLLAKGYIVHGIIRRSSAFNTARIEHLYRDPHLNDVRLFLHYGDLTDSSNLCQIVAKVRPDEVYNLGAMSHVKVSFEMSEYTADVDAMGTLRLLNCIRNCGMEKTTKFYQASTSELYGKIQQCPQNEGTPFYPRSPYGIAKQFAYWSVVNYREAYGMFAVNGILFNHESPRRGPTFVTRKISRAVVRIHAGVEECLYVGNLEAKRDWGHARDFVDCMWRMLQQEQPEDFVVATGECHSVREFIELAFARVGIKLLWKGARGTLDEIGVDANDANRVVVRIDPKYFRPTEVDLLIGDAAKAKRLLHWEPTVHFQELVTEMVDADAELLRTNAAPHAMY